MIGDDISITIHEVRSGQVKLGIVAPKDRLVHRFEIWNRIRLGLEKSRRASATAREKRERSA